MVSLVGRRIDLAAKKAKATILAMATVETVGVLVPTEHIAKVIGKAGAGLKQIREATRCKLQVHQPSDPNSTTRRVDIGGLADQVATAFQMLVLKAFPHADSTPTLLIPADKVGQVVGRGGDNLRKVREELRVRLQLEREPVVDATNGQQERLLTMSGEVSQMGRALRFVLGAIGGALTGVPAGVFGAVPGMRLGKALLVSMPVVPMQPALATQVRAPSLDPEEIQIHFTVPDRFAGVVLGKAGAQVKQTAATANCKVSMTARESGTERRAVIVGTHSQCVTAQTLLHEQLVEAAKSAGVEFGEVSVVFMIRSEAAGALIGKQGATLKQIRESSGAKIQLANARDEMEGQRPCHISGDFQNILQAEKAIFEVVRQVTPVEHAAAAPLFTFDAGIKRQDFPTFVPMAKRPRVDELEAGTKILVPAQSAGAVIGKQGSGLKEIRETTGAHVEMMQQAQAPHWPNDRVVILKGSAGSRQAAVQSLLRTAFQMHVDTCTLKVLVTPAQAGSIIGRQGGTLKRIREQCGISVQVEREEVLGERLVSAVGPHSQVAAAAAAILSILDNPSPPASGRAMPQGFQGPPQPQNLGMAPAPRPTSAQPGGFAYTADAAAAGAPQVL